MSMQYSRPHVRGLRLGLFDWLALFVALAAVSLCVLWAWAFSAEASEVHIATQQAEFIYPLEDKRHLVVAGPLGDTHIEISGGEARVTASPCRDKICIIGGWIDSTGEWLACLPNRIFIRIEGSPHSDLDARSF